MNPVKLCLIFFCFLLLQTPFLEAQMLQPDWAKQINSTNGASGISGTIATDKQGNVYALYTPNGYVYAGGQTSPDSTVTTIITSWDCHGNLRWMKSLGALGNIGQNSGLYLGTDTLGGIYISGNCFSSSANGSYYWDTDTTILAGTGINVNYIVKYNTQGQFQWLRTPVVNNIPLFYDDLSISPAGDVYLFALLDTGTYDGGSFTINTRKHYAIAYNAAGIYQAVIPLDATPPAAGGASPWRFAYAANRIYGWLSYNATYGPLIIGNTSVSAPTGSAQSRAVVSAFNRQGHNIWVRQASVNKHSAILNVITGTEGVVFLHGSSEPGTVFCGDTATNALGQNYAAFLMAIDSNASLL